MSDLTTTLSKRFDASPEVVFDAWTDPEGMGAWFSPMTTASVPKLDLRVGGDFQIDMHGEDKDHVHTGRYLEIEARLTASGESDDGVRGCNYDPNESARVKRIDVFFACGGVID